MKKHGLLLLAFSFCCLTMMNSCEKVPEDPNTLGNNAWVLNEGSWGANNACLDAINTASGTTVQDHAFLTQNGRGLGDLAQDMITLGNQLFISVSESNTIEVVDLQTGKSIHQIDMGNRYPRYLTTDGNKLYVSCYTPHSVVRIDPTSYSIEATCELTDCMQPEQLCYHGGKLYVCSGWQSSSNGAYEYDNKLAVVSTNSFQMVETITIGRNPNRIKCVSDKKLAISFLGNYADEAAGCVLFDVDTKEINALPVALSNFDCIPGTNTIIGYATTYDENWNTVNEFYQVNTNTLEATKILQDTKIANPYGININPDNYNEFLVCNGPYGSQGDIYCFSGNTQKWRINSNIFPNKVVWIPSQFLE